MVGATVYINWSPLQAVAGPLMAAGVAGTLPMLTASVCVDELPQLLLAITVILPPDDEGVTVMLLVVEVPVQPLGKVQV